MFCSIKHLMMCVCVCVRVCVRARAFAHVRSACFRIKSNTHLIIGNGVRFINILFNYLTEQCMIVQINSHSLRCSALLGTPVRHCGATPRAGLLPPDSDRGKGNARGD